MSREVLDESVSAVMDGEADELELRRFVAAAGEDPAVRERWARYQLARDVMHRQAVLPKLDLAAAVSAAIAAEDAQAAPVARAASPWRLAGRFAVAASVTLAVLAGVRFYNNQDETGMVPQIAAQQPAQLQQPQQTLPAVSAPQGPAVLASFPASEAPAEPAKPTQPDDLLRSVPAESTAPEAAGERAR